MILGGILLCAFGLAVYSMRPYGWEEMGALETAIVVAALTICAASCVRSLVKQMTPAARYQLRPELLPPIVVGVLAIGVAALFHFEREEEFWASTWICLKIGLQIALPTAVLVWLVVRMGLILSPGVTGGTVGVVAGLAAAGALEVHCPNVDAWHILASHLGVAVCAGLLGFIPGLAAKFRGRYRRLATR
jgi:hypothetical protein